MIITVRKFETWEEGFFIGAIDESGEYKALVSAGLFEVDSAVACAFNAFSFTGITCKLEFEGVPEWVQDLCHIRVGAE